MATETGSAMERAESTIDWQAGALGGVVGAFVMGVLMVLMNPPTLAVAIPSLYTLAPPPSLPIGMVVHLFHGAVLGVVYAAIAGRWGGESTNRLVGLGLGWGVVTWAVLAGLIMPVWLGAVGSPANPPLPNFAPPSLLWHAVYGLVLGVVFTRIRGRW